MRLWDIVQPSALTAFSRRVLETPTEQDYSALDAILPDVTVNSFKARIRTLTNTVRAAKFRAYNAENYIADRPKVLSIMDLTFPPLGQQLAIFEQELLEKAIASGDPNDDVIAQIYDDTTTNVLATKARMALAKGDLLTDGKFTLGENGVSLEADYGLTAAHKPTAAVLWSDTATATPLTDEQAWIQQMVTDGGGRPNQATTSLKVLGYLQKNAEYRAAYWGGNAGEKPNLNVAQVNQTRADNGLPPIVLNDTSVDVDGTTTRLIPDNRFILTAPGLGETQWGLTAQSLVIASGGSDAAFTRRDAPGLITAAYMEDEPVARWTSTHAVGMPLLADKSRIVTATVA